MNQIERRDAGLAYISDDSVFEEQKKCRQILQKLNFIDRSDFAGISEIVKELFGKSEGAYRRADRQSAGYSAGGSCVRHGRHRRPGFPV